MSKKATRGSWVVLTMVFILPAIFILSLPWTESWWDVP